MQERLQGAGIRPFFLFSRCTVFSRLFIMRSGLVFGYGICPNMSATATGASVMSTYLWLWVKRFCTHVPRYTSQ